MSEELCVGAGLGKEAAGRSGWPVQGAVADRSELRLSLLHVFTELSLPMRRRLYALHDDDWYGTFVDVGVRETSAIEMVFRWGRCRRWPWSKAETGRETEDFEAFCGLFGRPGVSELCGEWPSRGYAASDSKAIHMCSLTSSTSHTAQLWQSQ